jgi:hypothetical protein
MSHRRKNLFNEWDEQLNAVTFIEKVIGFTVKIVVLIVFIVAFT